MRGGGTDSGAALRQDAAGRVRTPSRVDPDAYVDAVLAVAGMIPAARVLTYGDIAELLDCGGPRQVGRALARSTSGVPWWRVLRAGGHPPRGFARQALSHYEEEGTALTVPAGAEDAEGYRVDLREARWWPSEAEQSRMAALGASLRRTGP
ncbi:MGMT family protein [Arthrobacter agilis]|jgi:alkylated DNA nucleotide flippase Atl1|uniref:MGMT family protein n=1 Tax=Arthrobacter agilis TaxID=37921 RepID=UPI00278AC0F0|nr:MGMT family protein [Arthrobacter agilis]MDQ0735579.1 alkylated DNA nucleotide flippase Atl1 [Arthrobacter agilis]